MQCGYQNVEAAVLQSLIAAALAHLRCSGHEKLMRVIQFDAGVRDLYQLARRADINRGSRVFGGLYAASTAASSRARDLAAQIDRCPSALTLRVSLWNMYSGWKHPRSFAATGAERQLHCALGGSQPVCRLQCFFIATSWPPLASFSKILMRIIRQSVILGM